MQVLLVEVFGLTDALDDIKLGKLAKKSRTFEEYVWKAVDKLKLDKTKVTIRDGDPACTNGISRSLRR